MAAALPTSRLEDMRLVTYLALASGERASLLSVSGSTCSATADRGGEVVDLA